MKNDSNVVLTPTTGSTTVDPVVGFYYYSGPRPRAARVLMQREPPSELDRRRRVQAEKLEKAWPLDRGSFHVIKCESVWVCKKACLSGLSGMTLKSVMHVTQGQEPHFSVMQKRSLSCRIGNGSETCHAAPAFVASS